MGAITIAVTVKATTIPMITRVVSAILVSMTMSKIDFINMSSGTGKGGS